MGVGMALFIGLLILIYAILPAINAALSVMAYIIIGITIFGWAILILNIIVSVFSGEWEMDGILGYIVTLLILSGFSIALLF